MIAIFIIIFVLTSICVLECEDNQKVNKSKKTYSNNNDILEDLIICDMLGLFR